MARDDKVLQRRKRRKIRQYFGTFPTWTLWLLAFGLFIGVGAGAACFVTPAGASRTQALPFLVSAVVVGLVACGTAPAVLRGRASDRQIDAWLADDIKRLRDYGLGALHLKQEDLAGDRLVEVWGPYRPYGRHHHSVELEGVYEVFVEADQRFRKGRDGRVRYSVVHLSIIFLTKHHLSAYSCVWDFARGEVLWEKTDEYFYQDVVSVSTETVRVKPKLPKEEQAKGRSKGGGDEDQFEEREQFRLTTSAATAIVVSLPERRLVKQLGEFVTSNVESNIRSIRQMLRQKKTGDADAAH